MAGGMDGFDPSVTVAKIREQLDHPVIDSDGHLVEVRPVAMEYIARAGGSDIAQRFTDEQRATFLSRDWYGLSDAERMARWTHRPPFWGEPLRNHGLDLATVSFPDLLYPRLDQLGIDFTVLPDHRHQPAGVPRRRRSARLLSRAQRLLRRSLDATCRPRDARRDHSDGHARRGGRG